MSDVVRNYTGSATPRRRPPRFRRSRLIGRFLLLVLLVVVIWALYATRDTHAIPRLIPADQAYQVYVHNLLQKRGPLLGSAMWRLLPEDSPYAAIQGRLAEELPIPEWVANNLLYGVCHVSGRDMTDFDDVLFITRMSRVGCLIERLKPLYLDLTYDEAGGLGLNVLPDGAGYYAVRGRLLAASPSREALVRALTLAEADALAQEDFALGVAGALERDVLALVRPPAEEPLGQAFESVGVTLQVQPNGVVLAAAGTLRPDFAARYTSVLGPLAGGRATAPPGGLLTVALDPGQPIPDFLRALDEALAAEGLATPAGAAAALFEEQPDAPPVAALLPAFGRALQGPGWLQWRGAALDAMVPLPTVVGGFAADEAAVEQAMARFDAPPEEAGGDPAYVPRHDADAGIVHLPLIGGPDIAPSFGWRDGRLLVSTSRAALEEALAAPVVEEDASGPANLRVRLAPGAACETVADVGRLLAEEGLLRGHTPATFEAWAASWCGWLAQLDEVQFTAGEREDLVNLRLTVTMAPESVPPVPSAE